MTVRSPGRRSARVSLLLLMLPFMAPAAATAQTFTRITTGPVATDVRRSGGCAWVDMNGDGHLDLFTGNGNTVPQNNSLYLSDRMGGFTAVTEGPVVNDGGSSIGGTWGDYDNDGDPDLFVTNRTPSINFLYRNVGGGVLERVMTGPAATDVDDSNASHWVDIDRDGDLDLFVLNFNSINFLYINDGNGGLSRRTTGVEAATSTLSIACAWGDYNNDGAPDLFVANGGNQNNDLYTNDGTGSFTRTSFTDGRSSLGCSWGDFDNDGDLDLFVANYLNQSNVLMRNEGAPAYTLTTVAGNVVTTGGGLSVGSAWGDIDLDGDLDLYVGNDGQPNFLYRNDGGGVFVQITDSGLTATAESTFGVTLVDFDNDGDLDAMDANRTDSVNALFRNEGTGHHWLRIGFRGTTSNRSGIGVRVTASALIDGVRVRQMREIVAQDGYNSQAGLIATFGFGMTTIVDTLIVRWPSGHTEEYRALPVDRILTVTEGEMEIVPVRLSSFSAERVGEGARLRWKTTGDSDPSVFIVERRDSSGDAVRAGALAVLPGVSAHEFLDASAPSGAFAYLLTAIDRDGTRRQLGSVAMAAAPPVPVLASGLPNPFRDRVSFGVSAPTAGPARVTVHDARGALVRVLFDAWLDEGSRSFAWDGRDGAGIPAPSSFYLIRLESGGRVVTGKITRVE